MLDPQILPPPTSGKFLNRDLEINQASNHSILCPQRSRKCPAKKAGGSICPNDHFTIGFKVPRGSQTHSRVSCCYNDKTAISILVFKNNKQNYPCNVFLFFKVEWFKNLPELAKGTYAGVRGGRPAMGLRAQTRGPFTMGYGHTHTGSWQR